MPYKINQQNERVVSVETSTEKKTRTVLVLCFEPANIHLLHHSDPKIKHTLSLKSSHNLRNFWLDFIFTGTPFECWLQTR